MICYKDMQFCNAKDCVVYDCRRNINGFNFTPDDFWREKVCIGNIKDKCESYKKEQKK